MHTILDIPLSKLSLHPALARVALVPDAATALLSTHHGDPDRQERGQELCEEWAAWVAEIEENGIREPLRVIPQGEAAKGLYWVIDGRHRFAAAEAAGLETAPCIVAEAESMTALASGTVVGRRHWTKSQRAFFAVLMNPEVATDAKSRQRAGKPSAFSAEGLAARFGVSLRLIEQAVELYRLLEDYPDFRDRIEPSLWGGASLGGLLQGLRALTDPALPTVPGGPAPMRHPPGKLSAAWRAEAAKAANWEHADADTRTVLARDLERTAAELPADYLAWKLERLLSVASERRVGPFDLIHVAKQAAGAA